MYTKIVLNSASLVSVLINLALTFFSYILGDKLFFLIPIIGIPFFLMQYLFLIPITVLLLGKNSNYKLMNVDVTSLQSVVNNFYFISLGSTSFFLALILQSQKVFKISLMWWGVDAVLLYGFMVYLTAKFFVEAKKQHVDLENVSLRRLYRELAIHVNQLGFQKSQPIKVEQQD